MVDEGLNRGILILVDFEFLRSISSVGKGWRNIFFGQKYCLEKVIESGYQILQEMLALHRGGNRRRHTAQIDLIPIQVSMQDL